MIGNSESINILKFDISVIKADLQYSQITLRWGFQN